MAQLVLLAALGLAAVGFVLCGQTGRVPRLTGGGLLVAAAVAYGTGWWIYDLPSIRGSWPALASDLAAHLKRLVSGWESVDLLAVASLVVVGGWLRAAYLSQPIQYDEAFTLLNFGTAPLIDGLSRYDAPNNHLLHTALLHFAQAWLGTAEWAIRVPALVAGILMIPATYVAIRGTSGREAGLLAASLVSASAVFVEFSTNARGYTLLCLILLLLVADAAYLRREWNASALLLFGILGALGFFTIPIMLYGWGAVMLWLALGCVGSEPAARRRRLADLARSVALTGLLSLLLYAPVLVRNGSQALVANRFVAPLPTADFVAGWQESLGSIWRDWNRHLPADVSAVLVAGFLLSLAFAGWRAWRQRPGGRPAMPLVGLALAATLWIVPVVLVQRVVPFERVWLFLLPLYFGLAATGIVGFLAPLLSRLGNARLTLVAPVTVVLAVILSTHVLENWSVSTNDVDASAAFLAGYLRPADRVVVDLPSDWPLQYGFVRHGLSPSFLVRGGGSINSGPAGPAGGGRVVIVVDGTADQTLSGVLASVSLSTSEAGDARLLRQIGAIALYEVDTAAAAGDT